MSGVMVTRRQWAMADEALRTVVQQAQAVLEEMRFIPTDDDVERLEAHLRMVRVAVEAMGCLAEAARASIGFGAELYGADGLAYWFMGPASADRVMDATAADEAASRGVAPAAPSGAAGIDTDAGTPAKED